MPAPTYLDVLVIGGGHAGVEAALACARSGVRTALITHRAETIGRMSCNPAIGGIGKSHLVREIDALGGSMALAADRAAIHVRVLNHSKGPAVHATRVQTDRELYRNAIQNLIRQQNGLEIMEAAVGDLIVRNGIVRGVRTEQGSLLHAHAVILATGTFLGGIMHVGNEQIAGGRIGDPASVHLAQRLRELMPRSGRLKTGTPPRIDGRSIDWSHTKAQPGDSPPPRLSRRSPPETQARQVSCHLTRTTPQTHDIIRAHLHLSPLHSGAINSRGPRYCPSIEDKIERFAERDGHQIFIEPEGLNTDWVYPNGISTSLPRAVQEQFVRTIPGFAQAKLVRHGYAIEYDFFDPCQLDPSLQCKDLPGLYLAGQINGTTGYEEAAAQGLLAGINAAACVQQKEPWWPRRDEAYLGVMIDDLITRGVDEPYRMFTSRAEYRLRLREDNADLRLTETGRRLNLVDDAQWAAFTVRREALKQELDRLRQTRVGEHTLATLLCRPGAQYTETVEQIADYPQVPEDIGRQAQIELRYDGYIQRFDREIENMRRDENRHLPHGMDYHAMTALSHEAREKLSHRRPATLGMAARIPGITPVAIDILRVHLKTHEASRRA